MNTYNLVYFNQFIRFLKENHLLKEYLQIMNNDFGYKQSFENFDDILSFIEKMMDGCGIGWSYEYNMLLCDNDIFINKEFRNMYDDQYNNQIDLFNELNPEIKQEILGEIDIKSDDISWFVEL